MRGTVITEGTDQRVLACPKHVWRLEDRTPPGMSPADSIRKGDEYIMDVCQECRAVRCSSVNPEGLRCDRPRHHNSPHMFADGSWREVGQ